MEFVLLSDTTLRFLALDDPWLKHVLNGMVTAGRLPQSPSQTTRGAYIVNTDPEGEPGRHWLAIWTENNVCEVYDSYGLPLTTYQAPDILEWLDHWPHLLRNKQTLQALNSAACGHCALMFLKDRARGDSTVQFVQKLSPIDLVGNDRGVGQDVRRWIVDEIQEGRKTNVTDRLAPGIRRSVSSVQ